MLTWFPSGRNRNRTRLSRVTFLQSMAWVIVFCRSKRLCPALCWWWKMSMELRHSKNVFGRARGGDAAPLCGLPVLVITRGCTSLMEDLFHLKWAAADFFDYRFHNKRKRRPIHRAFCSRSCNGWTPVKTKPAHCCKKFTLCGRRWRPGTRRMLRPRPWEPPTMRQQMQSKPGRGASRGE